MISSCSYLTGDFIQSKFKELSKQPNRKSRGWLGNRWESCPIGLPFKIMLQLHFEPVVTGAVIYDRDLANRSLTPASALAWARRVTPWIEDYYNRNNGGFNLLGDPGHKLTGKALYQLVLNGGLYDYDSIKMRGKPVASRNYFRNRPEWTQPQGRFKFSLVERIDQLLARAEHKGIPVTKDELYSIGFPFLAWKSRFCPIIRNRKIRISTYRRII